MRPGRTGHVVISGGGQSGIETRAEAALASLLIFDATPFTAPTPLHS
jgi:hypothetical protein